MKLLTLFSVTVVFLAFSISDSNGQIGEQIGDLAKKILPEWMTSNIANLISPTQPPEKRILFKLKGPAGFHIRPLPPRGLVSRPSKVYIKYALPQSQYYKMYRPQLNYINHPYQFEKVAVKPQLEYIFEKPSAPIAYQPPAPYPYYPPQSEPTFESGPIHTIPAPILGGLAPQSTNAHEQIYENQPIYYPQIQLQVQQQHQPEAQAQHQHYQVTEDSTNDVTVFDPFTGSQKLYAPDPDPSLPTKRLPIEVNPLSKPSVSQQLPLDVVKYNLVEHNELSSKLQEHIKKQQGLFHENPTSYNPTFLVTQSNNLLEQYQNQQQLPVVQLFRPEQNSHSFDVNQHYSVASAGQIQAAQLKEASQNENSVEGGQNFHGFNNNQHQGNAPGSYQYIFNDYSNTQTQHPKQENHFTVTHQQDYPYQLQQSILGDKLGLGSENIKIYVPDNYGIQSRSDDHEPDNEYTNHKRQYTEITRTPAPVREEDQEAEEDYEEESQ